MWWRSNGLPLQPDRYGVRVVASFDGQRYREGWYFPEAKIFVRLIQYDFKGPATTELVDYKRPEFARQSTVPPSRLSCLPAVLSAGPSLCAHSSQVRSCAAMGSKGRPYRTFIVSGYEILVGRRAEDNDYLAFEVAGPHDLWLHVANGTAGSHVVVRNPAKGEVPREVVERAASAAAWYSDARGAPRAEVHMCRVSDVSKPRGAPM